MTARMRVTWQVSEVAAHAAPGSLDRSDRSAHATEAWLHAVADADPISEYTRSRTTDTSIVEVPGLGRAVRKRWRWPGAAERLKGIGRTTALALTPAEREFRALGRTYGDERLAFHPLPLAFLVARRGALARTAMLLLTEIPDTLDLAEFLLEEPAPQRRRQVLADLARRVGAMHADGVTDGDCHPRNVLVDAATGRTWKVDCGRQRARPRPADRRRAEYDLASLDVGLARFASRSERVRALNTYVTVRADGSASRSWRSWSERVTALAARIAPHEAPRLPARRDQ